jgi:hypothetical protein
MSHKLREFKAEMSCLWFRGTDDAAESERELHLHVKEILRGLGD